MDIVTRKGSWYAYRGENLAQGRQRCVELLKQDEQLAADLEADVRQVLDEMHQGRLPESLRRPAGASASEPSEEESTVEEESYLE